MSDIVEMLVDAAGGNEAHVCAIAAAEIKRNLSQIEQLDARCGRLRDTCSTWERASNNYAEAVEIKDAEIERLQKYTDGMRCPACDTTRLELGEARAEIERLRGALRETAISAEDAVTKRDAEIERLREELRAKAEEIERLRHEVQLREQICTDATLYARRLQEADAEIEWLRERLKPSLDYVDGIPTGYGEDEIDRQQAEIERLRGLADVARLDVMWQELVRERDDAKREIERLRKDFSDLLRVAANDASEHQAEIERLRGLLRECIEWVEFKENGGLRYAHGAPELVKRIREALGDG